MTQEHEHPEVLPPGNQPKSFLAFLAEQGNGAVVSELSEELRDLVEAIEDHFTKFRGKVSGTIALNMKITLENGVYKVESEYATRRPKAPAAGTLMWLGRDGNLATQNPRQLTMPFTAAT